MSEADRTDGQTARARRLREQIEKLRHRTAPGGEQPSPPRMSPREFTDDAARAVRSEEAAHESVPNSDGDAGDGPAGGVGPT
jgi:hypothetical protein